MKLTSKNFGFNEESDLPNFEPESEINIGRFIKEDPQQQ